MGGIAIQLAKAGADIVVCGRSLKTLEETSRVIRDTGLRCSPMQCDVSDEKSVHSLVHRIIETRTSLDVLVNNAGTEGPGRIPMEQNTIDDYDWIMNANLKSQFLLCKAVIPHMKQRAAALKE